MIRDVCRPHGEGFVASLAVQSRVPVLRDLAAQLADNIQSNFLDVWTKAGGPLDSRAGDRACFKHALQLNATMTQPCRTSFRQVDPTGSRTHETFHITLSHAPEVQHVFRWDPSSRKVIVDGGGLYLRPVPQSVAGGFSATGSALMTSFTNHSTSETSQFKCNVCSNCGVVGLKAKRVQKCGRCGVARYCGRVCQVDHMLAHKELCDWVEARKHAA